MGGKATYAVVFREEGGPPAAGSLVLAPDRLVLNGGVGARRAELVVPLADVVEVHIGREPAERLNGHRTVVLDRVHGPAVQVALLEARLLHEIADLLTALTAERPGAGDVLAVVVPLEAGSLARVRELLAEGPPVDPASLGLAGHHVYLREGEAVFVFEGPDVEAKVRRAIRTPALWRAGIDWQRCIAGRPHIQKRAPTLAAGETPVYSWRSPASLTIAAPPGDDRGRR